MRCSDGAEWPIDVYDCAVRRLLVRLCGRLNVYNKHNIRLQLIEKTCCIWMANMSMWSAMGSDR